LETQNELNRIVGTSSAWSPERRARQRELIRCWAPWTRSSGPKTPGGKAGSSRNAEAFRGNPEIRRGWLLIEQFLRDGRMTPELGEVLLANELSAPLCDKILHDTAYGCDEAELGTILAENDLAFLADTILDDAAYEYDEPGLGAILAESHLSPVLLDKMFDDAAYASGELELGAILADNDLSALLVDIILDDPAFAGDNQEGAADAGD
jgi:hypothetical protein